MRTVRFLEDRTFDRVGLPVLSYSAGSVHTLKDDHARRWVVRGAAEYVAQALGASPVVSALAAEVASLVADLIAQPPEALPHGDGLESPPVVAGPVSGGLGERPQHVAHGGSGRPRGRPPGSRNK